MTQIHVVTRDGETLTLDTQGTMTVMEAIRDNGISEMQAICGGCLSCATCHVYVEPEFASILSPISEDEIGLLSALESYNERSRLSCQLRISNDIDYLKVVIAPED